jgi:hypothetical protein
MAASKHCSVCILNGVRVIIPIRTLSGSQPMDNLTAFGSWDLPDNDTDPGIPALEMA